MGAGPQVEVVIAVQAAAAVMFLVYGRRRHSLVLLVVSVAFLVAALLVAASDYLESPPLYAYGYSTGFAAAVVGCLSALKKYIRNWGLSKD